MTPKTKVTNKTEDTSKMKCSICKQEGHNKRSCKTMTTPVSAPKIETKTDVKVEPPVKVEMESYTTIIQSALDSSIDISCLNEKVGIICVKEELDVIIKNVSKSWAPFKAIIASITAKRMNPDWDTRKHQTQIGGKHSLRTIDRYYVSDYLFKNGFYDTATEFALTRSFEKAEPYNKTYSGKISPKDCKPAFLNLVEIINTHGTTKLLNTMLVYLMMFLKERKANNARLKTSTLESSKELTLVDVSKGLEAMYSIGSGISVVPVLVIHTLLNVIQPYLFPRISINGLKQHTAADNHSESYGDVEAFSGSNPVIAIEVKHKIVITESIIMTFDKKTSEVHIPVKFILTTAKTQKQFVKNNICIDTVSDFTTSYLQQVLLYESNICSIFVKELRTRIVSYHNISVEMKESINKCLTELLVSPSP